MFFTVIATQRGEAVSSAVVNVTIIDANDNSPIFEQTSYR